MCNIYYIYNIYIYIIYVYTYPNAEFGLKNLAKEFHTKKLLHVIRVWSLEIRDNLGNLDLVACLSWNFRGDQGSGGRKEICCGNIIFISMEIVVEHIILSE